MRHLKNIKIELSKDKMKHLILTGINGCGKTTVLDKLYSDENSKTQELSGKIYNGAGTAISEFGARNLKSRIFDEKKEFTECIDSYLGENDTKLRRVYWKKLKKSLWQ